MQSTYEIHSGRDTSNYEQKRSEVLTRQAVRLAPYRAQKEAVEALPYMQCLFRSRREQNEFMMGIGGGMSF